MSMKAILNGRVIDGTGSAPIEAGAVLVDKGRIVTVGEAGAVTIPSGAERIDASGKTVMPGLIDGHMHVTSMPGLLDAHGHLEQSFKGIAKLRACLNRGTTTVANMGGCPENVILRQAIDSGEVTGCARMIVFAMVNATGGHVRGRTADGPWEVRKAVREMILAGADHIKTAASGGFMWEHERLEDEDYTPEELAALVDEAHARRKRVAVHAHAQPGLNHSIEAGCDIIAHGALIDGEALEGIAAKNLHYMPTLYITSETFRSSRGNLPEHMRERMERACPIHRAGVRKAHEMGITISAGTDGGPGSVMVELAELAACGLSPLDAIVAATRNTADALGILDSVGTLEPGKTADLIIVDCNPLEQITRMTDRQNLLLVMKDGVAETARGEFATHLQL